MRPVRLALLAMWALVGLTQGIFQRRPEKSGPPKAPPGPPPADSARPPSAGSEDNADEAFLDAVWAAAGEHAGSSADDDAPESDLDDEAPLETADLINADANELAAITRAEMHTASRSIRTEIVQLRNQLRDLGNAVGEQAGRLSILRQWLDTLPDLVSDKIAPSIQHGRESDAARTAAEHHELRDQLTVAIGEQIIALAQGQRRLVDGQRASVREDVAGLVRDATSTLAAEQQRLAEAIAPLVSERDAAAARAIVEIQVLRDQLTAFIGEQIGELGDELSGVIRDASVRQSIDDVAEESRQFRARLAAAARSGEARFEDFARGISDRLDAMVVDQQRLESAVVGIQKHLGRLARQAAVTAAEQEGGKPVATKAAPKKAQKAAAKKVTKGAPARKAAKTAAVAKAKSPRGPTTSKRTRS